MNLKEIEARHESDARHCPHLGWHNHRDAHADRAFLLAEVRKLKGLCGRAADEVLRIYDDNCRNAAHKLIAELKEAASE